MGRRVCVWAVPIAAALACLAEVAPAQAQSSPLRLAAPADCPTNPNCIPGLRRVYGTEPPRSALVRLTAADAGIQALDDGLAELAVAFSSNPALSRPDVLTLRDDKRMIGPDHIVPVVRSSLLARYGAPLRRRLNMASRLLTTLSLRDLNQQVVDGRLPEAVGGEFAGANGLGGRARRRPGPRIVMGYQDFDENQTLAHFYAEALRGAGYRVTVRSVRGLRPAAVSAMRRGRIDFWPGYSGSLLEYLGGRSLPRALARIRAQPLRRAQAQNRNVFAMKRDVAQRLGISKLSDLAGRWPAVAVRARASADPLQEEQWAVSPGAVPDLPGAWAVSQGAGAVVAVVDSGMRLDHSDLAPNAWTNFREVPGNGADDDGNGYVDDVYGVDLTSTSAGQNLGDGHGHGTHVAGIIAAAANGRGVIGVAPRAKVMTVKVLDASGAGTTGGVAEGIRYAAAMGARVINASLEGDTPDPRVDAAIAEAGAANALVVVSAGNDARDIDQRPSYPASSAAPNVLAVSATAPYEGRTLDSYSNYGRLTVGLAAPGGLILSTTNDGAWGEKSGTSMAAPMVAGVAALVLAVNPSIRAQDLRALLLQHAKRSTLPVGAGYLDAVGSVLSAATAVGYTPPQPPRLRILRATADRRRTQLQVAVTGSTQAIKSYRVMLDGRRRGALAARSPNFKVTLPRRGSRVRVDALDASGGRLATAGEKVERLRAGKRMVDRGPGVRTT
jgi:glycine betaine/choline ABC-type transport system substrate-binding protein